jgi:hypothetical protein
MRRYPYDAQAHAIWTADKNSFKKKPAEAGLIQPDADLVVMSAAIVAATLVTTATFVTTGGTTATG